jgi:hypothetical protein
LPKVARIELHYLPSLEFFCAIGAFEEIQLEYHQHYIKQSFSNRCYINTSQGVQLLVVPLREKHGKIPIKDVKIDYHQKWQNNHWRSIESAYANSPYFEFYESEIKNILYQDHEFLSHLNFDLLSFCLRSLRLKIKLTKTELFEKELMTSISDIRQKITPKKSYLDRTFYHATPYQQVFGNEFVPNLSILDLLFCEGPHARRFLQSAQDTLNK